MDIENGIKRVGGDENFYKKLVIGFCDKYSNFSFEFDNLINGDSIEDATRLIHSIKGVAGNIEAQAVYKNAKDLEMILREEKYSNIEDSKEKLKINMNNLTLFIKNNEFFIVEKESKAEKNIDFNLNEFKSKINELYELCKSRNIKLIKEKLSEFETINIPSDISEKFKNSKKLILRYKFKNALAILEKLNEYGGEDNV